MQEVDVVIIGAGVSGLVAAHKLLMDNSSISIAVLEANNRIGGRVLSLKLPTTDGFDEWDFGAQWVDSSQHIILKLLKDFQCDLYSQYANGIHQMAFYNLTNIRHYSGALPRMNIFVLLDIYLLLRKIQWMVKQIPLDNPIMCKHAREWDCHTAYSFVERNTWFSATRALFSSMIRSVSGVEPSQVSLFYYLHSLAISGGIEALLDEEGLAHQYRLKDTVGGFVEKLAKAVGFDKIFCGDPVASISESTNSSVIVKTVGNCLYRTRFVICAIPPHLTDRIRFSPPLPDHRQQLNKRMPAGNMIKCIAVYKRAFWREKNFSGQAAVITKPYATGPLCITFDATTFNDSPALLGFISGEHAIYWSSKSDEERKEAVLSSFVALYGSEAKSELVTYQEKDWSKEEYIGGCTEGLMQPGCFVYFEHALIEPFGRIHWAGTETARRYKGYLDGAAESGYRAANEVTSRLQQITEVFQSVNKCSVFNVKT